MLTLAEAVERLSSTERGMAFVSPEGVERLNYAEIGAVTADLAGRWHGLGVQPGDRVIIALPSKQEFALAFLAAVRAGVVPVPVPGPERSAQVDLVMERVRSVAPDCQPKLVMTSPSLTELCSAAAKVPAVTLAGLASAARQPTTLIIGPDDVAFLQYTSGSTGAPKGIAISHANIMANLRAIAGVLQLSDRDVGVSWLPLHHDMGLIGFLLEPMVLQADVWHLSTTAFIERPTIWMDWMTRTRASIAYGPPFAYELVARRAKPRHLDAWDLSAWRVAGCGAEPLRPAVLRAFGEALRPAGFDARAVTPAYGLAEATLIVTSREVGSGVGSIKVDPDALANDGSVRTVAQDGPGVELVSCGPQVQDTEVRIAYDGGWGSDHQGEVWVRGASVARGYWNTASANQTSFADGWLRTGDLGFLKDGELYVTGRLKDLVIRNGSNYHPHDIEHAFAQAAGIRLSHIAAFSGAEEELVVAVEGRAQAFDGADVFAGIRHVLSTIGVSPDRVVCVPRGAIARTSSGKVRRQELRRRFIAGEIEIVDLNAGVGADRYGGEGA